MSIIYTNIGYYQVLFSTNEQTLEQVRLPYEFSRKYSISVKVCDEGKNGINHNKTQLVLSHLKLVSRLFKTFSLVCVCNADICKEHHETTCENEGELSINCPQGSKIKINSANYGRTKPDSEVCPNGNNENAVNCTDPSSKEIVRTSIYLV